MRIPRTVDQRSLLDRSRCGTVRLFDIESERPADFGRVRSFWLRRAGVLSVASDPLRTLGGSDRAACSTVRFVASKVNPLRTLGGVGSLLLRRGASYRLRSAGAAKILLEEILWILTENLNLLRILSWILLPRGSIKRSYPEILHTDLLPRDLAEILQKFAQRYLALALHRDASKSSCAGPGKIFLQIIL